MRAREQRLVVRCAFLLLVLAFVAPALADKPAKSPNPPFHVDIPAGVVCDFPVTWDATTGFSNVYVDRNGNLLWIWGGGNSVSTLTNVATGASIVVNSTGPGKTTLNADGSAEVEGGGHWLVGYQPTDSPSRALILYSGHIRLHVGPTGQLTLVSYIGTAPQDMCAALG